MFMKIRRWLLSERQASWMLSLIAFPYVTQGPNGQRVMIAPGLCARRDSGMQAFNHQQGQEIHFE
jgi:hypothetical protein